MNYNEILQEAILKFATILGSNIQYALLLLAEKHFALEYSVKNGDTMYWLE